MTRQFEEFQLDHFTPADIIGVDSRGRTKTRHIMLPDAEATQAHNIALKRMYADGLVDDPWAIGGMPGESLINNILPHKDNSEFYLLDIEDAFSQVSIVKLKEMFAEMFDMDLFDHETLDYYTEFLDTYASSYRARGLPQGAPCSPYLFNLYCQPMDYELGKFCDQNQLTYTRWLDDITVSSPAGDNLLGPAARKGVRDIIEAHGLPINHAKSKLHSLSNGPVTITGISLYPDRRIQPSPGLMDKIFKKFAEIEAAMADADNDEIFFLQSQLSGWNGVLESMTTPQAPKSETVIRAKRMYRELSAAAKLLMDIK